MGSFAGAKITNIGKKVKDYSKAIPTITNIKYPTIRWHGPIGNYGNIGAAVGAIVGGLISNSGGGFSW